MQLIFVFRNLERYFNLKSCLTCVISNVHLQGKDSVDLFSDRKKNRHENIQNASL